MLDNKCFFFRRAWSKFIYFSLTCRRVWKKISVSNYLMISVRVWSEQSIIICYLHTFRCSHWYSGMRLPIETGTLPAHWRRWPIGCRWSCNKTMFIFFQFYQCNWKRSKFHRSTINSTWIPYMMTFFNRIFVSGFRTINLRRTTRILYSWQMSN